MPVTVDSLCEEDAATSDPWRVCSIGHLGNGGLVMALVQRDRMGDELITQAGREIDMPI